MWIVECTYCLSTHTHVHYIIPSDSKLEQCHTTIITSYTREIEELPLGCFLPITMIPFLCISNFNIESGSDTILDVKASVFFHRIHTKKYHYHHSASSMYSDFTREKVGGKQKNVNQENLSNMRTSWAYMGKQILAREKISFHTNMHEVWESVKKRCWLNKYVWIESW